MRQALFLEPVDAWSFRDGRPFEIGEAYEARSLFPPYPWTVLGCLRTALLRELCGDPDRYADPGRHADPPGGKPCAACGAGPCRAAPRVGRPDGPAPFRIGPPLLGRRREDGGVDAYYPTPRDLVVLVVLDPPPRRCDPAKTALLAPLDALPPGAAHALGDLAPVGRRGPERVETPEAAYVDAGRLAAALAGDAPPWPWTPCAPSHAPEPRIGVGIDPKTRSVRQGQLYVRDVVRLEDGAGLVVATDQDLGLDGVVARLGGDGRLARLSRVAPPAPPPLAEPRGPRFKVYLAAPAAFGDPAGATRDWRPAWLQGGVEGTEPRSGARVRLRGAAVGTLVPVGGWDLARREPRPIRWLVPAGAVYFFEAADAAAARAAAQALHGQCLADDEAMARAGFGLAFAGRW